MQPAVLICGSADDRLVQELSAVAPEAALNAARLEESELFESCPIAFEHHGLRTQGFLQINGQKTDLKDVQGIILRLPRRWWPSQDFDLQDQMFVYHETIASWFALLDILKCPLVNRFGLGWWLQDLTYPLELRISLAQAIGLAVSELGDDHWEGGRLCPTQRVAAENIQSVYRSGGRTLPAPDCTPELIARLTDCDQALSAWEQETGIVLSRLDFERSHNSRLRWVEVFPLLEGEPGPLVRHIASLILTKIAAGEKVPA